MDKYFHLPLYWAWDYLSMLGLKLNHVNKRGPLWENNTSLRLCKCSHNPIMACFAIITFWHTIVPCHLLFLSFHVNSVCILATSHTLHQITKFEYLFRDELSVLETVWCFTPLHLEWWIGSPVLLIVLRICAWNLIIGSQIPYGF